MKNPKIMVIFGTRPEAIKMAPVVQQLQYKHDQLDTCVVVTAQHRSMLDQVLDIFHIEPDYDLDIMRPNQSLAEITIRALNGLEGIIHREKPGLVLVQGDTTTAFVGGLIAFYHKIPVGHVEAGLRTRNKYNPYPEEINRHLLDVLADLYFAPTLTAKKALLAEGILDKKILITGNTVIDALLTAVAQEHCFASPALQQIDFSPTRRTLLVTTHRRESLGTPLEDICLALRDLLIARKDLQIVFPVHLNPQVRETVWSILDGLDRAYLTDPFDYLDFIHVMMSVDLIVTDSGGIQEEAPSLGKPVFVIRAATERTEAIAAGTARLVGTTRKGIVTAVSQLLDDQDAFARMRHAKNPYGDGHAAQRIVDSICFYFGRSTTRPEPFQANSEIQSSQTNLECNTALSHNSDKFFCGF
jgi:UDP-N-acetylglucosamine 2-epimerase (non-hydrolysing)